MIAGPVATFRTRATIPAAAAALHALADRAEADERAMAEMQTEIEVTNQNLRDLKASFDDFQAKLDTVAKAAPDGYTILMATNSTHSIGPVLNPKIPYVVERDFAPITELARSPDILVASPTLGVNNVREFIALAKSKPGQLNFASSGNGTIVHLSGELFKNMAAIDLVHVPYKGTALSIPDLISGRVAILFENIIAGIADVKGGKVKALAISGPVRSTLLPELPTIAESGLPGFETFTYFGVFAPAGTPREILQRLNAEIVKLLKTPEMREALARQGAEPVGSTPEQLAAVVKSESEKWGRVIKSAGVKIE